QKVQPAAAGFTADGKTLVIAAGRAVRWLGLAPGKEVRRERWTVDGAVARISLPRRPPLTEAQKDDEYAGHDFGTFSPDGKLLFRRASDLLFRDSATGKDVMTFSNVPQVDAMAFGPDSRLFAG